MIKSSITAAIVAVTSLTCLSIVIWTAFAAGNAAVGQSGRVILHGNVSPMAKPEFDVGPSNPSQKMNQMILLLKMAPKKREQLDRLVAEQQNPSSANYHKWLTPEQFGRRFGQTPEQIATVENWLISQGFTIDSVAKSGTMINFSGTAADVNRAFDANMHDYQVKGHLRHANSTDPSIPGALANLVVGPVSLNTFPLKPAHIAAGPLAAGKPHPAYTSGGYYSLSPGDFAAIYDVNGIYNLGYTGKGVTIAIVGQAPAEPSMWAEFRSNFGLPPNAPTVITVPKSTPVDSAQGDVEESNLDVEWAGAVAPEATIDFVTAASVNVAAQYVVDHDLAPIMSLSYGLCESDLGSTWNKFYSNLWEQAAAEGITVFVSSGDNGAYACMGSQGNLAVNGLASTPYNIAVGGTSLSSDPQYWSPTNSAGGVSALSSIPNMPEVAWNDFDSAGGWYEWASGGGASSIYSKPSWQACTGVPNDGRRDLPDVSLHADPNSVPYMVYTCDDSSSKCSSSSPAWRDYGGTSAATPAFAGIMALIVQRMGGAPQGNANSAFYPLASAQYSATSTTDTIFSDITSGTNGFVDPNSSTNPNLPGYSCTTGYDQVTGLGSVDATNLLLAYQTFRDDKLIWAGTGGNGNIWMLDSSDNYVNSVGFGPYAGWTLTGYALAPDGTARLLWSNTNGAAAIWIMDALNNYVSSVGYGPYSGWAPVKHVVASDGTSRLLWKNMNGAAVIWTMDSSNNYVSSVGFGPYSGWTPVSYVLASDGTARLLWSNTNGSANIWTMDSSNNYVTSVGFGAYSGWTPVSYVFAPDRTVRLLWSNTNGAAAIWTLDRSNNYVGSVGYGPYSGWAPIGYSFATDGTPRVLWSTPDGAADIWTMDISDSYVSSVGFGPYSGWTPVSYK